MRGELAGLSHCIGVVLIWLCMPASAHTSELSMEEAVGLALKRNPEVRLARAELDAATAKLTGASLILQNNPQLSGGRPAPGRAGSLPDATRRCELRRRGAGADLPGHAGRRASRLQPQPGRERCGSSAGGSKPN